MDSKLETQIVEDLKQNDLSDFARYLGIDPEDIEDLYENILDYDDVSV